MAKENQARLLDILCKGCENNEIRGTGYIRCKTKTEDLCVASVKYLDKNNVFAIDPIEFPSWEDFEVLYDRNDYWSKKKDFMLCFSSRDCKNMIYAEYCNNDDVPFGYFDYSEQGYKQACDWIDSERIKFIEKLCGGQR